MQTKRLMITANEGGVSMHKDANTFLVFAPIVFDETCEVALETPLQVLLREHFENWGYNHDPFLLDIDFEKRVATLHGYFLCLANIGLMDSTDLEYADMFLRYGGEIKEQGTCLFTSLSNGLFSR